MKSTFLRHSGKAVCPKSLRSSFVTFIRDCEAAPAVLQAAANAMHHKLETADSDKYDRRTHDRLNESAVQFAEQIASKFTASPTPVGWSLLNGSPPSFQFVKGESCFSCTFDWFDSLRPDSTYRWETVPGLEGGFTWKTPPSIAGHLSVSLPDGCSVKAGKFTVTNLLVKSDAEPIDVELAPTEVMEEEDRPVLEDDDEWVAVEGQLVACRTDGDTFTVTLPSHPLLLPGCEVRILDGSVVEKVFLLPEKDGDSAYDISVRIPGAEGESATLTGLEVRAAAPVAKVRPQSKVKPPIPAPDAHSSLLGIGFTIGNAARNGDCFPLSVFSGFEMKASDRLEAIDLVVESRSAAVDLLTGTDLIGGIDPCVVREQEGLPVDREGAEETLRDWRQLGHFRREEEGNRSAAFMFAIAHNVNRSVIVLEKRGDSILDPCYIYGERSPDGSLVRTASSSGRPETVPFLRQIGWSDVLLALKEAPTSYSVVEYNRDESHHSPILYSTDVPVPPPSVPLPPPSVPLPPSATEAVAVHM